MKRKARPSIQYKNYATIKAYSGGVFLSVMIDKNYSYLDRYFWSVDNRGYARAKVGSKYKYMHRLILGEPDGLQSDHKNGNRLDNRLNNLRVVTNQQNQMARHAIVAKSGYKGVYGHNTKCSPWRAVTKMNGRRITIGYYKTSREAALAYNDKARELFGEYAVLNEISP